MTKHGQLIRANNSIRSYPRRLHCRMLRVTLMNPAWLALHTHEPMRASVVTRESQCKINLPIAERLGSWRACEGHRTRAPPIPTPAHTRTVAESRARDLRIGHQPQEGQQHPGPVQSTTATLRATTAICAIRASLLTAGYRPAKPTRLARGDPLRSTHRLHFRRLPIRYQLDSASTIGRLA
jgi:hypothetical protein